jgi:RNA polymerase sigma-70 factor (ECF subfamily)
MTGGLTVTPAFPETTQLLRWVAEMRRGDEAARDRVFRHCYDRVRRLTRRMLQDFPRVRRWEDTIDVLHKALMSLERALRTVELTSTRHFFALASLKVRRVLLDLVRSYCGPQGLAANHVSFPGNRSGAAGPAPPDPEGDPVSLAQWCDLQERIDKLPEEERDVFCLLFYQGLSQDEAAAVLGVARRTVQRRWQAALLSLHAHLPE